jgi:hypothetical protein
MAKPWTSSCMLYIDLTIWPCLFNLNCRVFVSSFLSLCHHLHTPYSLGLTKSEEDWNRNPYLGRDLNSLHLLPVHQSKWHLAISLSSLSLLRQLLRLLYCLCTSFDLFHCTRDPLLISINSTFNHLAWDCLTLCHLILF